MNKILVIALFVLISLSCLAQGKVGLIVAPMVSSNRVNYYDETDVTSVSNNGSELRVRFGLEFDSFKSDTYAISTGLIFAPKRVAVTASTTAVSYAEEYKVQYLQLPVTVKLFTSEVQPDAKIFFQLGFMGEVNIFSEPFDRDFELVEEFGLFDVSFTGGVGLEYGKGIGNTVYGGFFYDRGLLNIVSKQSEVLPEDLEIRTSGLSFKFGLKF